MGILNSKSAREEKRSVFFLFFSSALLFSRLFLNGDDEKAARARGEELKREKRKLCTDKPMRVFPPVLKRTACLIVSTKEQRRIYRIFFEEGLSSAVEAKKVSSRLYAKTPVGEPRGKARRSACVT